LLTGIGVCWIFDGFKGVKKGLTYVLPVSFVMAIIQFFTLKAGMYSLVTLNAAFVGLSVMFLLYKFRTRGKEDISESGFYRDKLNLWQAIFPYALILMLLLSFQLIPNTVREVVSIAPNFKGFETTLGHTVAEVTRYSPIRLFVHPVFVLLIASAAAIFIYKRTNVWTTDIFRGAVQKTVKKGIPATLALLALGNMSLVMMESGMTTQLADAFAGLTGRFFPLFSPFLGMLSSFLTGNNTNANVLFGTFQYAIANHLQISTAVMVASQSLSASVGVTIGPTLVLMGALASDQVGQESTILKKLIPIVLLIALTMGIVNYVLSEVLRYGV